jgi:DNA-binding MarR family transcriptional regulator
MASSKKHPEGIQSMGFRIWELSNKWQREFNTALQPAGITHAQFLILSAACTLAQSEPGGVSQSALSKWSHTDKMMTSKLVRTLTQKKHIKKSGSTIDARANRVSPTEKGLKVYHKANQIMEGFEKKFFAPFRKEKAIAKRITQVIEAGR